MKTFSLSLNDKSTSNSAESLMLDDEKANISDDAIFPPLFQSRKSKKMKKNEITISFSSKKKKGSNLKKNVKKKKIVVILYKERGEEWVNDGGSAFFVLVGLGSLIITIKKKIYFLIFYF